MNQKEALKTVAQLQNLLFSESKPPTLRPVDIALVSYLLLRQTEDHHIYDSHLTLANRLGCERRTIAESIRRLTALGWIATAERWQWSAKTKRKTRSIGQTAGLSVNMDKLPQAKDRTKHSQPSPEAVTLANKHSAMLVKQGLVKRLHKTFDRQQAHAAQRLIDYCGGYEEARALVNFAGRDKRYGKAAAKSLYELRTKVQAIKRDYDAAREAA